MRLLMGVKSKTNYMTSIILWAKIGTITQIKLAEECFPHNVSGIFLWLFVYLLYHHYFLCTITDWLSFYFFFYNKPHCWKENVSQGQRFSGRIQKEETFQKHMKEMEFGPKIILVIEKIFYKLFTLSLAYLKSFSWFLKQSFQTVMKGQHSFLNRSNTLK